MKKIFISFFLLILVLKCYGRNPCDEVKEIRIKYSKLLTLDGISNPCKTFEDRFVDPNRIPTIVLKDPEEISIVVDRISEFKSYDKWVVDMPVMKIFVDYGCRIDVICVDYTYYATVNYNGVLMQSPENYAMEIIQLIKKYDPSLVTNEDLLRELGL